MSYLSTDATGCALLTGVLVSVGACTYTILTCYPRECCDAYYLLFAVF